MDDLVLVTHGRPSAAQVKRHGYDAGVAPDQSHGRERWQMRFRKIEHLLPNTDFADVCANGHTAQLPCGFILMRYA